MPRDVRHVRLPDIPKPPDGSRSVIVSDSRDPEFVFFRGEDPDRVRLSLDCGNCGKPLIVGVPRMRIHDIVLRCPRCGSYNET